MISAIVPAHNEEAVIGRGLDAMAQGAVLGELEIIVVCNGCSDRTADVARAIGTPVRVLEIETASKVAALNAGDAVATGFPRFYIDADVIIHLDSIRRMAAVLERGDVLMANPALRLDNIKTTWPVRAYYRFWTALPYNNSCGMVGTGVYAVSRAGRTRWDRFPDLISDDGFVRFCFASHERACVEDAISHVAPPHTFRNLIMVKTRSRLGLYQLQQMFPQRNVTDRAAGAGLLSVVRCRPALVVDLPVYLAISVITRLRAKRQFRRAGTLRWERDETSRAV